MPASAAPQPLTPARLLAGMVLLAVHHANPAEHQPGPRPRSLRVRTSNKCADPPALTPARSGRSRRCARRRSARSPVVPCGRPQRRGGDDRIQGESSSARGAELWDVPIASRTTQQWLTFLKVPLGRGVPISTLEVEIGADIATARRR
jgi:hypothetical protein